MHKHIHNTYIEFTLITYNVYCIYTIYNIHAHSLLMYQCNWNIQCQVFFVIIQLPVVSEILTNNLHLFREIPLARNEKSVQTWATREDDCSYVAPPCLLHVLPLRHRRRPQGPLLQPHPRLWQVHPISSISSFQITIMSSLLHSHGHPHHFDHRSEIPGQVLPYPLQVTASVNLRSIFEVRIWEFVKTKNSIVKHSQVDEVAQSVTVDTTLRFKWKVMLFGLKIQFFCSLEIFLSRTIG